MGNYSIDQLPTLIIKEENCHDMDKLEKCVVTELETCKESTPANLVEALFRFVRKETPCVKYPKQPVPGARSSSFGIRTSLNVLLGTGLIAFVAKALMYSH